MAHRMEKPFLQAIRSTKDDEPWLVFADWLEEAGDPRAQYVRLCLLLRYMAPDDINREQLELELGAARDQTDDDLVRFFEPNLPRFTSGNFCGCHGAKKNVLHNECPEFSNDDWGKLCKYLDGAGENDTIEVKPLRDLNHRGNIITLPSAIGQLKSARRLYLYGSSLVRIPPEIGEMDSLEEFTPYTSYWLHWFPYEITRCQNLHNSTISTRALYGNYKNGMKFPDLQIYADHAQRAQPYLEFLSSHRTTRKCSVCKTEFVDRCEFKVWITQRVATDIVPLLVNACSQSCLNQLTPAEGRQPYHRGGPDVASSTEPW